MGNIILIGFMGSGKTSIGKKLAERLNYCFCDVDRMIERDNKKSIPEIFEAYGEEYFRNLEINAIKGLKDTVTNCIVSVGGGLPMKKENHQPLKELGKIVYLKVPSDIICKRLENDTTRPILQVENKEEKVMELMKERDPIYEQLADKIVDSRYKDFHNIVDEIYEYTKIS